MYWYIIIFKGRPVESLVSKDYKIQVGIKVHDAIIGDDIGTFRQLLISGDAESGRKYYVSEILSIREMPHGIQIS